MITKRSAAEQAALNIIASKESVIDIYVPVNIPVAKFKEMVKRELKKRNFSGVRFVPSTVRETPVIVAKKDYRPLFGKCQRMERYRFEHRNEAWT